MGAQSGTRGREPVASRIASASNSSVPAGVSAATEYAPVRRPVPRTNRTPCDSSRLVTLSRSLSSIPLTRERTGPPLGWPPASSPLAFACLSSVSSLPVFTIALLGMQSHRCAAPPMMSRSIIVTSAPSDAATVAAVFPAGPPPMITKRTAMGTRVRAGSTYPDRLMQQLLVDALTGDQVILAPARALRPDMFRVASQPKSSAAACPFCDGHEAETPPEVMRIGRGAPDTPGWDVRVVPNKYPIVGDGVDGVHEVVILSPAHDADLGDLPEDRSVLPLLTLRDRARFHLEHGLTYAQAFVNVGKAAGASIEHPHAQLAALAGVPPRAEVRLEHFSAEAFNDDREFVVEKDADVAVWCPRASFAPFFTRLALVDAGPRFDEATDDEIRAIGG